VKKGSSSARDAILARLRDSLAAADSVFRSQSELEEPRGVPSDVTVADAEGTNLAEVFCESLRGVLGSCEIAASIDEVPVRVVQKIEGWRPEQGDQIGGGEEVLSWAENALPLPKLHRQLEAAGISIFVPDDMDVRADRDHASMLSIGLTGVDAAFASIGTMAFVPGPGKSRSASLLPLHHIALVPESSIYPNLEKWLAVLRESGELEPLFRDHSQLAFVTGPSKSADIELNLTLGVHGPREVHAIVFDDGRTA